jgi:PBSX family phage terminase large subunit
VPDVTFGSPLPIHVPFHSSPAPERAAIGAFGSGKSYALCDEAIACGLEQPGARMLISRWTAASLKDSTEAVFFDRLPPELYQAGETRRIGGHVDRFIFPNGSIAIFKGLDDWKKLRSANFAWIFVDEADEIDEETWDGLKSRVRQVDITSEARQRGYSGSITRRGMVLACNPAGHNWIFNRFVDAKTRKDGSAYFRSTSFDNPFLPADTLEGYLGYPEQWVKRYVLCQFDDFAGQIYESWGYDTHVIPHYMVPKDGLVWMGMDPGTRNPTAGLWVHVTEIDGRKCLVGVAEYEQAGLPVGEHAKAWRKIERELPAVRWRVSDPSIQVRDRGTNMSLADQYRRLQYNFQLGPRTHKDRIPMLGNLIATRQFLVTDKLPLAYEAIKGYRWEDLSAAARAKGQDAPERPVKANDHIVDSAQYVSSRWAGRPTAPQRDEKPKTQWEQFSDDARTLIRRNMAQRVQSPGSTIGSV